MPGCLFPYKKAQKHCDQQKKETNEKKRKPNNQKDSSNHKLHEYIHPTPANREHRNEWVQSGILVVPLTECFLREKRSKCSPTAMFKNNKMVSQMHEDYRFDFLFVELVLKT